MDFRNVIVCTFVLQKSGFYTCFVLHLWANLSRSLCKSTLNFTMQETIMTLEANHIGELVTLPHWKVTIRCNWVYKVKYKANGDLERYKTWMVTKVYNQKGWSRLLRHILPSCEDCHSEKCLIYCCCFWLVYSLIRCI